MTANKLASIQLTKEQREWLEVEASNTTESHATIIRKLIQEKINYE
jgi:predicted DNA-binding protein